MILWEVLLWTALGALIGAGAVILWRWAAKSRDTRLIEASEKMAKRVGTLPSESLPLWLEQALGETGRAFSLWRRGGDEQMLDEAVLGGETIAVILREMRARR